MKTGVSPLGRVSNKKNRMRNESKKRPWGPRDAAGDNFRGSIAKNYLAERVNKPVWHREHEAVRSYLALVNDGASVLDVPFGTGRFVDLYLQKQMKVSGIDISPAMLAIARSELGPLYETMDIRVGSAESLPFADASFDVVVSIRFLESIIPIRVVAPVLREMRRVCRRYAVIRLNNRRDGLPPVKPPAPDERMGSRLFLYEVEELVCSTGWELTDSVIVALDNDNQDEKRICLLKTN
jgi:SAM-dependent methyltransferase